MFYVRLVAGLLGGGFIFLCVVILTVLLFERIMVGIATLDLIIGFGIPFVLGTLAGYHTFSRTVWPKKPVWSTRKTPPIGHCHQCGYNLTGNVSGTCPECGTRI